MSAAKTKVIGHTTVTFLSSELTVFPEMRVIERRFGFLLAFVFFLVPVGELSRPVVVGAGGLIVVGLGLIPVAVIVTS